MNQPELITPEQLRSKQEQIGAIIGLKEDDDIIEPMNGHLPSEEILFVQNGIRFYILGRNGQPMSQGDYHTLLRQAVATVERVDRIHGDIKEFSESVRQKAIKYLEHTGAITGYNKLEEADGKQFSVLTESGPGDLSIKTNDAGRIQEIRVNGVTTTGIGVHDHHFFVPFRIDVGQMLTEEVEVVLRGGNVEVS